MARAERARTGLSFRSRYLLLRSISFLSIYLCGSRRRTTHLQSEVAAAVLHSWRNINLPQLCTEVSRSSPARPSYHVSPAAYAHHSLSPLPVVGMFPSASLPLVLLNARPWRAALPPAGPALPRVLFPDEPHVLEPHAVLLPRRGARLRLYLLALSCL